LAERIRKEKKTQMRLSFSWYDLAKGEKKKKEKKKKKERVRPP